MCIVYHIYTYRLYIFFSNVPRRSFNPGPDEQQNRRARLMNGKSRTRYSPKWQTQPPPTSPLPPRMCLTLSADRPLTSPTSVQTHPAHCKIIIIYTATLSPYPRTAHDLSTRSLGRRKSTAAVAQEFPPGTRCTLSPIRFVYIHT